jgi:hypothetical protein
MVDARRDRFTNARRAAGRVAHGLVLAALVTVSTRAHAEDTPGAPPPSQPAAPSPSSPPPAEPPPPPAPAPIPQGASPTLSYALLGAGGVSLVVGAIFGVLALSDKSSFDSNPSYDKSDSLRDKTLVADVGLGLGVILAGTGTAFLLLSNSSSNASAIAHPESHKVAQVRVAPMVGPSRGGAMLSVSFQ